MGYQQWMQPSHQNHKRHILVYENYSSIYQTSTIFPLALPGTDFHSCDFDDNILLINQMSIRRIAVTKYILGKESTNLALKGKATQSSTSRWDSAGQLGSLTANLANDGDFSQDPAKCALTKDEIAPWWQVDLLSIRSIHQVAITLGHLKGQIQTSAML